MTIRQRYQILWHLIKGLVTERYKRMAKDEVLFRFISGKIDPVLLVDYYFQAEREALDLAEMSLLKLVTSDQLMSQIMKSAERIQLALQRIFGTEVSDSYASPALIEKRRLWIEARVDFYRRWLSIHGQAHSPLELAQLAFRNSKNFSSALKPILKADRECADEIVHSTNSLFRFLMRKEMDYELENSLRLWSEFIEEAFKEPAALP